MMIGAFGQRVFVRLSRLVFST